MTEIPCPIYPYGSGNVGEADSFWTMGRSEEAVPGLRVGTLGEAIDS